MREAGVELRIEPRLVERDELPEVDPLVATGGDQMTAVGGEEDGADFPLGLFERVEAEPVAGPPQLDCLVGAGRGEELGRRMPGEIEDGAVMDIDRANEVAGGDIPEPNRPVVAGGGQKRAVGGELGVVEEIAMAAEGPHQRA